MTGQNGLLVGCVAGAIFECPVGAPKEQEARARLLAVVGAEVQRRVPVECRLAVYVRSVCDELFQVLNPTESTCLEIIEA